MNGIRSLNAGAYANLPQQDIRLSGDHRSTYTQRRRAQMAGGGIMGSNAGSMLVAPTADGSRPGYGILDSIKKRVGKLIPNELKNPLGATAAAVAANYLPTVLGKETVLSQLGKLPFIGPVAETIGNIGTGIGDIIKGPDEKWGGVDIFGLPGRIGDAITPDMTYIDTKGQKQKINYGLPLALGAAAGEYQRQYLKDQPAFPMDETGIKFQTAQEAMDDPNLRFKPEAQYANVAEGGRIGYDMGGEAEIPEQFLEDLKRQDLHKFLDKYRRWQEHQERKKDFGPGGQNVAQGGRIGYNMGGIGALNPRMGYQNAGEVENFNWGGPDVVETANMREEALFNNPLFDRDIQALEKEQTGEFDEIVRQDLMKRVMKYIRDAGGSYKVPERSYWEALSKATEAGDEDVIEYLSQSLYGYPKRVAKQAYDDMQIDMAQGGRIGYTEAGAVDPEYNGWKKIYERNIESSRRKNRSPRRWPHGFRWHGKRL